jgi:hypothetical protein
MQSDLVDQYITQYGLLVPSMGKLYESIDMSLNPLFEWFKEQIQPGPGAYLGAKVPEGEKGILEASRGQTLYPAYILWAKSGGYTPLSHRVFASELIQTGQLEGINVEKVIKHNGIYLTNIQLKPGVFDRDTRYGSQIISTNELKTNASLYVKEVETSLVPQKPTLEKVNHPVSIDQQLYTRYISLLRATPLKTSLNNAIKSMLKDETLVLSTKHLLTNKFMKQCKMASEDFQLLISAQMEKGLRKIQAYGCIPFSYKQMGLSPRILPLTYGNSINSVKRLVRDQAYEWISQQAVKQGYLLVDLDLKSCYTSILLGLYPQPLVHLQNAIEGKGLWQHIKEEFEINGQGDAYNKPAVKICTYASFFLGGNRAMINGILDHRRLQLGLTQDEFRNTSFYSSNKSMLKLNELFPKIV